MTKFLTLSEKLDFFDKINNSKDEKELELLFDYIETLETKIREYELNINLLLNVYNKNN
jgi:hypothetical protein